MSAVRALHVVIPAHREEELIARQLTAVRTAVEKARIEWTTVKITTTVVLDDCDDRTAQLVTEFDEVFPVPVRLRCVGAARAAGIEVARRRTTSPATDTWVAGTDADSVVPEHWVLVQLEVAAQGADLVLGTVMPERDRIPEERLARWHSQHRLQEGHPHVHGANLGFRLSAYDRAGGFRPLRVGEDADLAHRMQLAGSRIVRTARHPVLTSARSQGRAPEGFSAYLHRL